MVMYIHCQKDKHFGTQDFSLARLKELIETDKKLEIQLVTSNDNVIDMDAQFKADCVLRLADVMTDEIAYLLFTEKQ